MLHLRLWLWAQEIPPGAPPAAQDDCWVMGAGVFCLVLIVGLVARDWWRARAERRRWGEDDGLGGSFVDHQEPQRND